jgi:hypothetical protein
VNLNKDHFSKTIGEEVTSNTKDIKICVFKPAIHYNDAFDGSHVDDKYSYYQGTTRRPLRSISLLANYNLMLGMLV